MLFINNVTRLATLALHKAPNLCRSGKAPIWPLCPCLLLRLRPEDVLGALVGLAAPVEVELRQGVLLLKGPAADQQRGRVRRWRERHRVARVGQLARQRVHVAAGEAERDEILRLRSEGRKERNVFFKYFGDRFPKN